MDSLATKLRGKAKFSETGVVISETDFEEVFTKFVTA